MSLQIFNDTLILLDLLFLRSDLLREEGEIDLVLFYVPDDAFGISLDPLFLLGQKCQPDSGVPLGWIGWPALTLLLYGLQNFGHGHYDFLISLVLCLYNLLISDFSFTVFRIWVGSYWIVDHIGIVVLRAKLRAIMWDGLDILLLFILVISNLIQWPWFLILVRI